MQRWKYFIFILLSFVLYGNTAFNRYSLDDAFIQTPSVLKGISGIPEIITSRYSIIDVDKSKSSVLDYRPVALVTFAIEYQLFKVTPYISHLINVALYALCLIVLYRVLIVVFKLDTIYNWLPFLCVIMFAAHPVHTEVVASLKNRDEIFTFLFGMLFLLYSYRYFTSTEKQLKYLILSILFYLLCFSSKQVGILYYPIFILILVYNNLFKLNLKTIAYSLGLLTFTLIALYFISIGTRTNFYLYENSLVGETNPLIIFMTCFKVFFYHIKMLLFPYPLRMYYGYNMFPLQGKFDSISILSFLIYTSLFIFGLWSFLKKKIIGLFILCFLSSIILYFNFPFIYTGMFSERAMFLSSIWFIIMIALLSYYLLNKIEKSAIPKIIMLFYFMVFIIFSYYTIQRNFDWRNSYTLSSKDITVCENSINVNHIFANNAYELSFSDYEHSMEMAHLAAKYFQKIIDIYPEYPDCFFRLAQLNRYKFNNIYKAENLYKSMLVVDSNYAEANFELGKIYFENKDFKNSYQYLSKAYQSIPNDSTVLFYLGQNALAIGKTDECYRLNKQFLSLYPNLTYPYLNMGIYYSSILKDDSAVIYLDKAIELGDRNPELLKNMVIYYNKKQNMVKANYYNKLLNSTQ